MYYFLLILYLIGTGIISKVSLQSNQADYLLRKKYNINYSDTEFTYSDTSCFVFALASLLVGLIAGATSLGIDTTFTPLLLAFGFSPKVAAATGIYFTAIYALGVFGIEVI